MTEGDQPSLLAAHGMPNGEPFVAAIAFGLQSKRFKSVMNPKIVTKLVS